MCTGVDSGCINIHENELKDALEIVSKSSYIVNKKLVSKVLYVISTYTELHL